MCAAALGWAQITHIIYGANDEKKGYQLFAPNVLHPKSVVKSGILAIECSTLIKQFFANRRR